MLSANRVLLSCALMLSLGAVASRGQSTNVISSDQNGARPLSEVLSQLRKNEKVPICYEDPRYRHPDDLQDVTEEVHRGAPASADAPARVIVPRGRALGFIYSRDSEDNSFALNTVERMVKQYAQLGGPNFSASREGVRILVQPHLVKDEQGREIDEASVLATQITLSPKLRTGSDLLEAICQGVKSKTGFEIGVGPSAPVNLLDRYHTSEGFKDQPAQQVLLRLLDSIAKPRVYVWDLYYDPTDHSYGLNFAYVDRP